MSENRILRSGVRLIKPIVKRPYSKRPRVESLEPIIANEIIDEELQSNTSFEVFGPDVPNVVAEEQEEDIENNQPSGVVAEEQEEEIENNQQSEVEEEPKEAVEELEPPRKRKRRNFVAVKKYTTYAENDLFIRSSHPKSTFKMIYNHMVNCTLNCYKRNEEHKMKFQQCERPCDVNRDVS